jgi:hypothetical protein
MIFVALDLVEDNIERIAMRPVIELRKV